MIASNHQRIENSGFYQIKESLSAKGDLIRVQTVRKVRSERIK
jgi:hypothetical protein